MKKILILGVVLFSFFSCGDITELNENVKNPQRVEAGSLFANATVEMFDFMASTNVNVNNFRLWSQYWAQTTYADESNFDLISRNVNGRTWNTLYATVIRDLTEARTIVAADEVIPATQKQNQLAIFEVMEVFAYHVLVDIFGDVPYTQALTEDVTPAYDNDADIYADLADRLDAAIADMGGETGLAAYDLIYGGDADMWKKMANSLKLRLAIRMADVNDAKAKTMAEEAVASGVFTSNADNFALSYSSSTPNTNPLWEDLVQSGRSDFIAANTLTDVLNALNDPRTSAFFTNLDAVTGDAIGGAYGDNNSYAANSQPGEMLKDPTLPGVIIDFAEVSFLLADASERGYNVGGTAAQHYENGVTASIESWGGDAVAATAYLLQPDVAYATAPGTWKEKIAKQKWLALYNRGFEGWSTFRLYDAPTMNIAVQAGTLPPTRFTYPVTEFSLNGDNVAAAATAIGGDNLMTKVFWDVN